MKRPSTPVELLHKCSRKQQAFILALVSDPTITQREAFRRAGYSAKNAAAADSNASKLLRNPRVKWAYDALKTQTTQKAVETAELSAARVLEEVRRLAFVDVSGCFDDTGNLKKFSEWTVEQRAALTGFVVIIKNAQAGDGVADTVYKIKMGSKTKSLELLMKHFTLLVEARADKTEDWEKWAARLASARQRP